MAIKKVKVYPGIAGGAMTSLTDVTITSAARGDIIARNATVFVNLAAGTVANAPLVTETVSGDPNWSDTIAVDTVTEYTADTGVTLDGIKLKDSIVYTDNIVEKTDAAGVTIDGVQCKDGEVRLDSDESSGAGVVTLKDNGSGALAVRDGDDTADADMTVGSIVCTDGASIEVDTLNEATSAAGVTVDSVLIKDQEVRIKASNKGIHFGSGGNEAILFNGTQLEISTDTEDIRLAPGSGTVDFTAGNTIKVDTINEAGNDTGVLVDGVRCKDGGIICSDGASVAAATGVLNINDQIYGMLSVHDGAVAEPTADATFRRLQAWDTNGLSNGVTLSADSSGLAEGNSMQATVAGTYEVFVQVSFTGEALKTTNMEVFKRDESDSSGGEWATTGIGFRRKMGTSADIGSAAISGFVYLDALDQLAVYQSTADGNACTVTDGQFTMKRISD